MDSSGEEPRPYPLNRYLYYDDFETFSPFGYTMVDDMLESVADVKHPTVMILECGDLRHVFFTLWKNFRPDSGDPFSGASFVLTDSHPAIVARNLIFIYLSLRCPENREELKKWMAAVWAIWYCHELHKDHEKVLISAIQLLIRWTEGGRSWMDSQNPLRTIVRFAHPSTLKKVNTVLKMWYNREVRLPSLAEFKEHRNAENRRKLGCDRRVISFAGLAASYGFMQRRCTPDQHRKNEQSYDDYYFNGSLFVEEFLSLPVPSTETTLNLTFFERADGKYTVDYNCIPQQGYAHCFRFSPSEVARIGMPTSLLLIEDETLFEGDHFILVNSFNQFSMWFLGVGKVLSLRAASRQPNIVLVFKCADPLDFCQQLHMNPKLYAPHIGFEAVFDLILVTTYLVHYPPSNLLFTSLPILKPSGYLHMNVLVYKQTAPTAERLLEKLFGFDTRLLPIICGARCIGQEAEYTSPVSALLSPWSYATAAMLHQSPKLLVWQKVSGLPLKLSQFTKDMHITRVLSAAIGEMMASFFNFHPSVKPSNHLSVQAGVGVLRAFAMQLDAETPVASYQFWEPLCSLLKEPDNQRSYLLPFELHAHLIGIHLHLTVTEENCPLCNKLPLTEYIATFAIDVPKKESEHIPTFMVYIHDSPSTDILELKLLQSVGGACHVFDCLDVSDVGDKTRLQFIAPRKLLEGHYLTAIRYGIPRHTYTQGGLISIPMEVGHGRVADFLVPSCNYSFKKFRNKAYIRGSSFGKVTHHYGDGVTFESVVSLSDAALNTLERVSLGTKSISNSAIELSCGKHTLRLNYPHWVDYNKVGIKLSRKSKTVSLTAPRKAHFFCDEKPLATVNPDFTVTFMPGTVDNGIVPTFVAMQFTKSDRTLMDRKERKSDPLPLLVNVKEYMGTIFEAFDYNFFEMGVEKTDHVCLMVIHNRLLDFYTITPALDFSFCYVEPSLASQISYKWQKMVPREAAYTFSIKEPVYALFQKVLNYFARRTRPSTKAIFSERHRQMVKLKLSKHFTRAIVYPLFTDPDVYIQDMGIGKALEQFALSSEDAIIIKPDSPKQKRAAFTPKVDDTLLLQAMAMANRVQKKSMEYEKQKAEEAAAIAHKEEVQKQETEAEKKEAEAQMNEVQEQKNEAAEQKDLPTKTPTKGRRCHFCGKHAEHIKRCARCGKVQYCGRQCQKKHWKEHKLVCQQSESTEEEETDEDSESPEETSPPTPRNSFSASAESNGPLPTTSLTFCKGCGKAGVALRKCPCHLAAYCSVQCQKNDWVKHRDSCTARKATK